MPKALLLQIAILLRRELNSNRSSLLHGELENFVGCLLAEARGMNLLSVEEEKELRKRVLQ